MCHKHSLKEYVKETGSIKGKCYLKYKRHTHATGGDHIDKIARMGSEIHTRGVDISLVVP